MARKSRGRSNIPEPTLRPVASPVDTFYQPQVDIPAGAVDNMWLQAAKAMQGLSPSLKGFLKTLEGKREE